MKSFFFVCGEIKFKWRLLRKIPINSFDEQIISYDLIRIHKYLIGFIFDQKFQVNNGISMFVTEISAFYLNIFYIFHRCIVIRNIVVFKTL